MAAPIQKELGLTEKQKSQLKKLDTTMSQKRRQMFTRSRQGATDPEKMRGSMDSLRREQEEAISNILEPKQKTRLGEIELQREGIFAVARTDVAKKLKLTSTQTDQIKTIVDQMHQDERAAMPGLLRYPRGLAGGPPGENGLQGGALRFSRWPSRCGRPQAKVVFRVAARQAEVVFRVAALRAEGGFQGGGPWGGGRPGFGNDVFRAQFEKIRQQQEKIRATATQQITEVLTTEQKTSFNKMQGKPFDLSLLRPGPGNGPRNSTRATRSTGRTRAQTKQRARRGAEPEPGLELQPGSDDPQ